MTDYISDQQMQEIEAEVRQYSERLEEFSAKPTAVRTFLVGSTGAGKSALRVALGGGVQVVEDENSRRLFDHPDVGHTPRSKTVGAVVQRAGPGFVVDFGGFRDSRGTHVEVINMLLLSSALRAHEGTSPVCVLFVVPAYHFKRGACTELVAGIQVLRDTFPDFRQVAPALGLVLSFADDRKTAKQYLGELVGSDNPLIEEFYGHFSAHLDSVFLFPEPATTGSYDFKDRLRIIDFAAKNTVLKPSHRVGISDVHKLAIRNVVSKKEPAICDSIAKVSDAISNAIASDSVTKADTKDAVAMKLASLQKWKQAIDNIKGDSRTAEQIISHVSKYKNIMLKAPKEADGGMFVQFVYDTLPHVLENNEDKVAQKVADVCGALKKQVGILEEQANLMLEHIQAQEKALRDRQEAEARAEQLRREKEQEQQRAQQEMKRLREQQQAQEQRQRQEMDKLIKQQQEMERPRRQQEEEQKRIQWQVDPFWREKQKVDKPIKYPLGMMRIRPQQGIGEKMLQEKEERLEREMQELKRERAMIVGYKNLIERMCKSLLYLK